jgi:hypothetical protein
MIFKLIWILMFLFILAGSKAITGQFIFVEATRCRIIEDFLLPELATQLLMVSDGWDPHS